MSIALIDKKRTTLRSLLKSNKTYAKTLTLFDLAAIDLVLLIIQLKIILDIFVIIV